MHSATLSHSLADLGPSTPTFMEYKKTLSEIIIPGNSAIVDLSSSELEDLEVLKTSSIKKLNHVVLSSNKLVDLQMLNTFTELTRVIADNNLISQLSLNLLKLTELNLSKNRLLDVPDLSKLPKLQNLNLSHNHIKVLNSNLTSVSKVLKSLDLSHNELSVQNGKQIQEIIDQVSQLEVIQNLNFSGNPLIKQFPEIRRYLIKYCAVSLKFLNDEFLSNMSSKQRKDQSLKELSEINELIPLPERKTTYLRKSITGTIFDNLLSNLRSATTNPSKSLEHVAHVTSIARDISQYSFEQWENMLVSRDENRQRQIVQKSFLFHRKNQEIDEMLDNFTVLIDNYSHLQNPLLTSLAGLSKVSVNQLGLKAFLKYSEYLRKHTLEELKNRAVCIFKTLIINQLAVKEIKAIPAHLISGLNKNIEVMEHDDIFSSVCPYICNWTSEERLVSKLVENPNLAMELVTLGYVKVMKMLFKSLLKNSFETRLARNQFFHVLKIIQNTARISMDAARSYYASDSSSRNSVFDDIQLLLFKSMQLYLSGNHSFESHFEFSEDLKLKNQEFSILISAMAALIHHHEAEKLHLLLEEYGFKLLELSNNDKIDPIILTALCHLAHEVISSSQGMKRPDWLKKVVLSMKKFVPLLEFFKEKDKDDKEKKTKYEVLCKAASIYAKGSMSDDRAVPFDMNTNPVVHKLLAAIIKLFLFVSKFANKKKLDIHVICIEFSEALNANSRQIALFNAIKVPDYSVRIEAIKCLAHTNPEDFSPDEVNYIIKLIDQFQTFGHYRSHEVLTLLVIMLAKILKIKTQAAKQLIAKYGEITITQTYEIMLNNMSRDLSHSSHEEKEDRINLGLACVYFLRVASTMKELQGILESPKIAELFTKTLKFEEKYLNEVRIPTEIELSHSGFVIDNLIKSIIAPSDSITCQGLLRFRIISRIADILSGVRYGSINEVDLDYITKSLREPRGSSILDRMNAEIKLWSERVDLLRKEIMESVDDDAIKYEVAKNNQILLQNEGLRRLVLALICGTGSIFRAEQMKKSIIVDDTLRFVYKLQQNKKNPETEPEKHQTETETNDYYETKTNFEKDFDHALRAGRINLTKHDIEFSYLLPPNLLMKEQSSITKLTTISDTLSLMDKDAIEFILPNYTLSKKFLILNASAILRVIYATISFAPNPEIKKEAIQQIASSDVFFSLSQYCSSTGWDENSLMIKFLILVEKILEDYVLTSRDQDMAFFEISINFLNEIIRTIERKSFDFKNIIDQCNNVLIMIIKCLTLICNLISDLVIVSEDKDENIHNYLEVTTNDKALDYFLSKLIPVNFIYLMIDIIFILMEREADSEELQTSSEHNISETLCKAIGNLIVHYLAICKEKNYSILKYITDKQIFEDKFIRNTFLQECLDTLRMEKSKKIMLRFFTISKLIQEYEKIRLFEYADISIEEGIIAFKKLFVLTDSSIFVISAPKKNKCTVCPPEFFCPSGPQIDHHIEFKDIHDVVDFEKTSKIGVRFEVQNSYQNFLSIFCMRSPELRVIVNFLNQETKAQVLARLKERGIFSSVNQHPEFAMERVLRIPDLSDLCCVNEVIIKVETRSFFGEKPPEKKILMMVDETLYILFENLRFWKAEACIKDECTGIMVSKKGWGLTLENGYYKPDEILEIKSIIRISFDNTNEPTAELATKNLNFKITFKNDSERENFRYTLVKKISNIYANRTLKKALEVYKKMGL